MTEPGGSLTTFPEALVALQSFTNPIDAFVETPRPELVEEALAMTGTASIRRRKIPADQVVWLMVGMSLYAYQSIKKSFDSLEVQAGGKAVSSSISDARKRLGPTPMEYLFRKIGASWTQTKGASKSIGMLPVVFCARIFCQIRGYLLICQRHEITPTEALESLFFGDIPRPVSFLP